MQHLENLELRSFFPSFQNVKCSPKAALVWEITVMQWETSSVLPEVTKQKASQTDQIQMLESFHLLNQLNISKKKEGKEME